jgi:hypothetical protein
MNCELFAIEMQWVVSSCEVSLGERERGRILSFASRSNRSAAWQSLAETHGFASPSRGGFAFFVIRICDRAKNSKSLSDGSFPQA